MMYTKMYNNLCKMHKKVHKLAEKQFRFTKFNKLLKKFYTVKCCWITKIAGPKSCMITKNTKLMNLKAIKHKILREFI